MKIYFNSTFIEKERITNDLWVKGNNGNKLEAYFDDLDLSNVNTNLRIVIGWSDGTNTNELPMQKAYDNSYAFINMPTLKYDGITNFTILIYQNDTLLQTAIFSRVINKRVDANDTINITREEYEYLLSLIGKNSSNNNAIIESAIVNKDDFIELNDDNKEPYLFYANINLNNLNENTFSIELINDNLLLFANYGFAIYSVNENIVTIYSMDKPEKDVTLKFEIVKGA